MIANLLISFLWLVIEIAVVIGIYYVGTWFIGWMGAGEPWPKLLKLVIGITLLIIVVLFLVSLFGGGPVPRPLLHLSP